MHRWIWTVLVLTLAISPVWAQATSKVVIVNGGTIKVDSPTAEIEQLRAELAEARAQIAKQQDELDQLRDDLAWFKAANDVFAEYFETSTAVFYLDTTAAGKVLGEDLKLDRKWRPKAEFQHLADRLAALVKASLVQRGALMSKTGKRLRALPRE